MTIHNEKVRQLLGRARREVDDGLLPSVQVALAYQGEIVAEEAFGVVDDKPAALDNRYCFFSATKPLLASVMWILMAQGKVDPSAAVVTYFPEFAGTDDALKAGITVEQVMLHTSGFPMAPLGPPAWTDRAARVAHMASWRVDWQPGSRYIYHATSAHWVLAEIIQRVTGNDFRDEIQTRVTDPAGLPRLLGIDKDQQQGIAPLVGVGDVATADEIEAVFGVRELPANGVTEELLMNFNDPSNREVGVPGGGGFGRARDLALFHQELLNNNHGIWDPNVLSDATGHVRNSLPDPMGVPVNRTLGLILAGDDGYSNVRGFGRRVSAQAFGHNGAAGQLAWVDPATGLSLGYLTNGCDRHMIREARRGTAISSMAAECVT
jgi:CubicO group peptidase (beta-lactamase class C family)